jgi:hypothetical protein
VNKERGERRIRKMGKHSGRDELFLERIIFIWEDCITGFGLEELAGGLYY